MNIAELANDAHALTKEFGDYSFLSRATNDTERLQALALAFGQVVIDDNNLQRDFMLTTEDEERLMFIICNAWMEGFSTGFRCCEIKSQPAV